MQKLRYNAMPYDIQRKNRDPDGFEFVNRMWCVENNFDTVPRSKVPVGLKKPKARQHKVKKPLDYTMIDQLTARNFHSFIY